MKVCGSDNEYFDELKRLIKEHGKKEGLTAIICRDGFNLEKIHSALGDEAPRLIAQDDSLPKEGVFFIELALAKGLEFDNVIIADGDPESYPDTELGKHCLYTAMSRATRHLTILTKGVLAANIKR